MSRERTSRLLELLRLGGLHMIFAFMKAIGTYSRLIRYLTGLKLIF